MLTEFADEALRLLAKRLSLTGPMLFLDLETTGTAPDADRIVQIAYSQIDVTGAISRHSQLVNPGVPIPPSATEIHHITDADVAEAPRFAQIASAVIARLAAAQVVSGFNVTRFDLPMIAAECTRAGMPFDPEDLTVIDAQGIFHRKEPRSLEAAMLLYCESSHDGAHDAQADVDASVRVLAAQLEHYSDLPTTVGELAEYSANRSPDALDHDGKIIWRNGAARLTFGKWSGVALDQVDRDYFSWMLRQTFGRSTSAIIRAALVGEFPAGPRVAA